MDTSNTELNQGTNGRKSWAIAAMAAGLAFVAMASMIQNAQSREVGRGAPAAVSTSSSGLVANAPLPAPLDADVDWSKVRTAENPAPMAVAAYDR